MKVSSWSVLGIALGALVAMSPACGQARAPCNATTCSGCCDASGACQLGNTTTACGSVAASCKACEFGQVCSLGLCQAAVATGGGAGGSTGGGSTGGGTGGGGGSSCGENPPCLEESSTELEYKTTISTGAVSTVPGTSGTFVSTIDARAGGINPTESFIYVHFTSTGLASVAINDAQAMTSTDWDLAFRRTIVRANSGHGGPSCVQVAKAPEGVTLNLVTSASGLQFRPENFYSGSCELISDGSGLGTPNVALAPYFRLQSCLQMTGNVFVLKLADGRHVKLQITRYYGASGAQEACDLQGSAPPSSDAAVFTVRWAFLP
ncbi:MAG: HmuY family protein [Archangium sp.]|nr:HmuY family protein [Archangium sp.]